MEFNTNQKLDPVWSILPSYDMYQNTFSSGQDPPQYADQSSVAESSYESSEVSYGVATEFTAGSSIENQANIDASESTLSNSNPSLIVADESTNSWRETILDNIENLRNYSSSKNPFTQNVSLSIHFTEDVSQPGIIPKLIDPLKFEYKQGDYLNGYILILNKGPYPLPFNMFYVLFEGSFSVTDRGSTPRKKKIKIKKFLEMYDFVASWNQSRIDRLLSEIDDDHSTCKNPYDPLDLAKLCMESKELKPGVLYKRFFTFKIPERLLDTECNDHNLLSHTFLPPTLGLSMTEKLAMERPCTQSNDFCFVDASTSYSVLTRFIGKASDFEVDDKFDLDTKLVNATGDEFIIFRDSRSFIRVIPESQVLSDSEIRMNAETARVLHSNLLGRISEKIELGTRLRRFLADEKSLTNSPSTDLSVLNSVDVISDAIKARHLYTSPDDLSKETNSNNTRSKDYEVVIPIVKKRLIGTVKYQGMLRVSSPKTTYFLSYMSPKRFRNESLSDKNLCKLKIPLSISFQPGETSHSEEIPCITQIIPELAVFTMKAGQFPLPIEITHDHLFQNRSFKLVDLKLLDNFGSIVQEPMRKHALNLYSLAKELGSDQFKLEKSLLDDVSALASVESKTNNLSLRHAMIEECNGSVKKLESHMALDLQNENGVFTKNFSVLIDVSKAQKKTSDTKALPSSFNSFDQFCLVPSFQNCNMVRMYYLRLIIQISNGDMVELKLPVTIAKLPNNQ